MLDRGITEASATKREREDCPIRSGANWLYFDLSVYSALPLPIAGGVLRTPIGIGVLGAGNFSSAAPRATLRANTQGPARGYSIASISFCWR